MKKSITFYLALLCFPSLFTFGQLTLDSKYDIYYLGESGGTSNPPPFNLEYDQYHDDWKIAYPISRRDTFWSKEMFIPPSFTFYFYDHKVEKFKVSLNGLLTFSDINPLDRWAAGNNQLLPSKKLPPYTIAAFWDLYASSKEQGNAVVRVKMWDNNSISENRQLWIRWEEIKMREGKGRLTFSIVLEENTNKIFIVKQFYRLRENEELSSTVGIQKDNETALFLGNNQITWGIPEGEKEGDDIYDNYYFCFMPYENKTIPQDILYPNPNNGKFYIKLRLDHITTVKVKVMSLQSTCVYEEKFNAFPWHNIYPFHLNLSIGAYIVFFEYGEFRKEYKMIVRHGNKFY